MNFRKFLYVSFLELILSLSSNFGFAAEYSVSMTESEVADLAVLAQHPDESMRFKLLNSRFREKSSIWEPFLDSLTNFAEQDYLRLQSSIVDRSILEIQEAVNSGELSYEELVTFYIYRIRKTESDDELFINSIISLNPNAINRARQLDEIRESGAEIATNLIFGIPVLLKDNIGFAGLPTTAGAFALNQSYSGNAYVTDKLIEGGAVILGKANLSEWAYFFCRDCPSGYSALGGQTLNPYGRFDFGTGGSSSGSGASIAANFAAVAVGSETSGSILSPSSANSLVGLKPTTGSLSRTGVVPISSTLDTVGPMGRSVADVAILFNAMAGFDTEDLAMPLISDDLRLIIREAALNDRRFGMLRTYSENTLYRRAMDLLSQNGFSLQEVELQNERHARFSELLGAEMKRDLALYLDEHASDEISIDSIKSLQEFNLSDLENRAPYGQALVDLMVDIELTAGEVEKLAADLRDWGQNYLDRLFMESGIDILFGVNNHQASIAALGNYPALTIPMGYSDDGRPMGLTLIAPPFQEQLLIDAGIKVEKILEARQTPISYP